MNGMQLAASLRTLRNRNFTITLVSADEIENDEKLFDFTIEKPVPMKKILEIYQENLNFNKSQGDENKES